MMFKRVYNREPTDEELTVIDNIDFTNLEDYLEDQWMDIEHEIREAFGDGKS